jgi:predicted ATPase
LNIPIPLTSFIGREKELKAVADLISKSRLVTLTGSGGVGKTRTAIQVVADVLELFPDGVWFVDLAPLVDPELVPYTLASLLGLRESGELPITNLLINYFHHRTALVVFDNCEHLIESCSQLVNSLLTFCEHLSVLATSREALRVSGEIPYRVPSLEIPKLDIEFAFDEISGIESVKLFAERAARTLPGFVISSQNARFIAQICQRLDGIPLAIELAAARANMLTIEQILERLDDRFNLLTGGLRTALPRHQTLRATIEWSYDLLSEQERIVFRRLAVFMGGWTLEAAEEVCRASGIEADVILDLLSQLVNKSMVIVENFNSRIRYRRLETIRQFAREKLGETAEAEWLQDRHLIYFLKKAEEAEPKLSGAQQLTWMDYLDLELENIRLALAWSISNQRGEEALRMCGALGWFWYTRCHIREGEEWSKRALELRDEASDRAQARALRSAGWMYFAKDDFSTSTKLHQESLDYFYKLGDMKEIATALQFLGILEFIRRDFAQARTSFEKSLAISRRVDNKLAMPRTLIHLGYFAKMEGDYSTVWQLYGESLALCRELQDDHLIWNAVSNMGQLAYVQKNNQRAREYYKEALEICIKLKNKRTTAETLLAFAEILCAEGQYAQSAGLQGFAETLFNESESLTESHLTQIKGTADSLRIHLGDYSYQKEFKIGRTLRLEQAVEIALKQNG